jgi:hypothetical protein
MPECELNLSNCLSINYYYYYYHHHHHHHYFCLMVWNWFCINIKMLCASQKTWRKGLLLLDQCSTHPSAYILKSGDGKIWAKLLAKNMTVLIHLVNQGMIWTCKAYYYGKLLVYVVKSPATSNRILENISTGKFWFSLEESKSTGSWKLLEKPTSQITWSYHHFTNKKWRLLHIHSGVI